jgi:hypothetical protein
LSEASTAAELFSTAGIAENLRGMEQLRWLDANGDNYLDGNDPGFWKMGIWRDLNQNGVNEVDEWKSIYDSGFRWFSPILMDKPVLIIRVCRGWPCACPKTNQPTLKQIKDKQTKNQKNCIQKTAVL